MEVTIGVDYESRSNLGIYESFLDKFLSKI